MTRGPKVVGFGRCVVCGEPTRLRKGIVVRFCSAVCRKRRNGLIRTGKLRREAYYRGRGERP